MSGHRFVTEQERLAWELTPQPGWIASPDGPLLCWYHPPRAEASGPAVLLCDTLGSDRMNLHLAYRHLALQLAWAGYPVLRVDYAGTGDSAGHPREPDRLNAWLRSLDCGAEHLRALSGARELVVFGALLGATLGAALAAHRDDVTGLVSWGGYARGKDFLRQLKALERLSGANPQGRRPARWEEGDLESLGFLFTAETVAALTSFDAADLRPRRVRRVCVLPWDEHDRIEGFAAAAVAWGVDVDRHDSPPSSGAASLQHQAVPDGVIAATIDWLSMHRADAPEPPVSAPSPALSVRIPGREAAGRLVETCVWMGADRGLFGILTEQGSEQAGAPDVLADAGPTPTALILVNGGNNHRAGINRNYTEWARRWAGETLSVLRLDIRGLGDSPPLRTRDLNVLYRPETAGDVIAAMDWLERHRGIRRFVLGGLCAGAFQALHAARQDRRVVGLWLLELLRFYHEERSWHVRVTRRLRRAARRLLGPTGFTPAVIDTPLGRWLRGQCGRGVRVLALYRRNEPMLRSLTDELASAALPLSRTGNFEIRTVDDSNHIFSPLWSQAQLTEALDSALQNSVDGARTEERLAGR